MKNFKQYLTEVQEKKTEVQEVQELIKIVPDQSTSVVKQLKGKSVADFTTTETYMKKNPSETKNKDLVYSGGEVSGFGVARWEGDKVVWYPKDSVKGLLTETRGRTMFFFYLLA